jgi:hypothetical protein
VLLFEFAVAADIFQGKAISTICYLKTLGLLYKTLIVHAPIGGSIPRDKRKSPADPIGKHCQMRAVRISSSFSK